jgi:hypothetical protein
MRIGTEDEAGFRSRKPWVCACESVQQFHSTAHAAAEVSQVGAWCSGTVLTQGNPGLMGFLSGRRH